MVKLSKIKIYNVLVVLFLINGVYFFFYPELVHEQPVYKYFKYLLYLIFLTLTINYQTAYKLIYGVLLIPLALYYFAINSTPDIIIFINYTIPLFILFCGKSIDSINWKWVIKWVLYISFAFGVYEVLILENHYYMYNRSLNAYRVVSIYINPNNFGIIVAILSFVYIRYYSKGVESLIIYVLGLTFVKLSGSKTGLVVLGVYSVYLFYFYFKHRIKTFFKFLVKGGIVLLVLAVPIFIYIGYYFYETISKKLSFRTFDWET